MRPPKIPATMTVGEINRELDKLARHSETLNALFIAAGRGGETSQETWKLTDPLALEWQRVNDRCWKLRLEIRVRADIGSASPREKASE
jgi:hypothetical protein